MGGHLLVVALEKKKTLSADSQTNDLLLNSMKNINTYAEIYHI